MVEILIHTTRAAGTVLSASIYNEDHLRHVTNALALDAKIDSSTADIGEITEFRDDAEAARDKAKQWAENAEDEAIEVGEFSSKHHAIKSASSASEAAIHEANAEISSNNALISANDAASSSDLAFTYQQAAQELSESLWGTSESSVAIGLGSKTFETQFNKVFFPGREVVITSEADPTNRMFATVTSYDDTTLVVDVILAEGDGTHDDWLITLTGVQGPKGDPGSPAESDMLASVYDPQEIEDDAFDRANHTGTQTLATISDAGLAAALGLVEVSYSLASKAELEAKEVSGLLSTVRLRGYLAEGDGGAATYIRVGSEPGHIAKIQSADGAWWELADLKVNPFMLGVPEVGDAQPALQAFFDFVRDNRRVVDVVGSFDLGSKLVIGHDEAVFASRVFHFDCTMKTTYSSEEEAIKVLRLSASTAIGTWRIECGSTVYENRRQWDGLVIERSERTVLPVILVIGVKRDGFSIVSPSSNMGYAPMLRPQRCGGKLPGTLTDWTNNGSSNSINQTATLTVADIPDALAQHDYILHNGYPHAVTAVDHIAGTVTVYPWLASPVADDPIEYVVGSGVKFLGSDSNLWRIGLIDAIGNGTAYKALSLYPPQVDQMHANVYGIGVVLGRAPNQASVGGSIGNLYLESGSNHVNFVQGTSSQTSFFIGSAGTPDISQFFRLTANNGVAQRPGNLSIKFGNFEGNSYESFGGSGGNATASTVSPDFGPTAISMRVVRNNTQTINLPWHEAVNRLFGMDTIFIFATGGGPQQNPTGTWTFNPPDGWTINGDAAFSGMTHPTLFSCYYDVASTSVTVTPLSRRPAAAAQANSTASTISGMVADFNALLEKLRTAGVITP